MKFPIIHVKRNIHVTLNSIREYTRHVNFDNFVLTLDQSFLKTDHFSFLLVPRKGHIRIYIAFYASLAVSSGKV